MSTDHTQQLWQAAQLGRYGDYAAARELIIQILKEDPKNVTAWWGIANYSKSPIDRRKALTTILRLQPDHEAARNMLTRLDDQFPPPDSKIEFEERSLEFPIPKAPPPPPPLNNTFTQASNSPWNSPQMPQYAAPPPRQQAPHFPPPYHNNAPWNNYPYQAQWPSPPKPRWNQLFIGALLVIIPAFIMLLLAMSNIWSVLSTEDIFALLGASLFGTMAAIYIVRPIVMNTVQHSPITRRKGSSRMVRWAAMFGACTILSISIILGARVIDNAHDDWQYESQQSELVGVWRSSGGVFGPETLDFRPDGKLYQTTPLGYHYVFEYYMSGGQELTLIRNAGTASEDISYYTVRDLDSSSLILYSEQSGIYTYVRIR